MRGGVLLVWHAWNGGRVVHLGFVDLRSETDNDEMSFSQTRIGSGFAVMASLDSIVCLEMVAERQARPPLSDGNIIQCSPSQLLLLRHLNSLSSTSLHLN